jgi:uncharacterized protein (AIM24 family)
MQFDIAYRPAHTLAIARLNPGEAVTAESGAMVAMSTKCKPAAATKVAAAV